MKIKKNDYINKLDEIANKHNNKYHRTIKMKPVAVKLNTYINASKGQIPQQCYHAKRQSVVLGG